MPLRLPLPVPVRHMEEPTHPQDGGSWGEWWAWLDERDAAWDFETDNE